MLTVEPHDVSCVIPQATTFDYLEESVRSAICQGFKEVVIVNQATPLEGLQNVASMPGVRMIHLNSLVGVGPARNIGIESCETRFVMLLDHDDVLCDGYLRNILAWVNERKLRCAAGTAYYIGENSSRRGCIVSKAAAFVPPSGFLAEKSLVAELEYFPNTTCEDIVFFHKVRMVTPLTTCPTAKVLYRIHQRSMMMETGMNMWAFTQLFKLYLEGKYTLEELNKVARDFAGSRVIPPGLESYLQGESVLEMRQLARTAYAAWLNRDFAEVFSKGFKLLRFIPEAYEVAYRRWTEANLAKRVRLLEEHP